MKKYRHLYGPVPSRRLGRSLGVDLVPHKICTYDCIYCQIGKTTTRTLLRKAYIPKEEILEEVKAFLLENDSPIDHLSLAGSGEPTLHSEIRAIIEGLKEMTSIPIAVITNGSLLWDQKVREDLLEADILLPSMDAVSDEVFERVNRPLPELSNERIIEGMVQFRKVYKGKIWLEILFCKGVNDTPDELQKMKDAIDRIKPDQIHLNTVVRPPSEKTALSLSEQEMNEIKAFFGERASIIPEYDRHPAPMSGKEVKEGILRILKRRPLSLTDLSKGMGIVQEELEGHLRPLIQEGKIRSRLFGDSVYYEIQEDPE